jgi:hypothetical protein
MAELLVSTGIFKRLGIRRIAPFFSSASASVTYSHTSLFPAVSLSSGRLNPLFDIRQSLQIYSRRFELHQSVSAVFRAHSHSTIFYLYIEFPLRPL